MQLDLVIGGVPKRLIEAEGAWTLEVARQVAVERNVYRPELRKLSGREAILTYLRQDPQHEHLAHGALELLRLQGDGKPRRYEAVNGEWVPAEFLAKYTGPRKPQAQTAPSERAKLVAVQAECLRLRHVVSDLSLRVAYLEKLLTQGAAALPAPVSAPPRAEISAPAYEPGHARASVAPPPSADVEAPRSASIAPGARLDMPSPQDLIRCLEQLIGSDVSAAESKAHLAPNESALYASILSDASGAVVAAILMDLRAVVYLGGTLLMIPESELGPLVTNGAPSEDCLAASSELCGSFSTRIASAGKNPNLEAAPLAPLSGAQLSWANSGSNQLTLQDNMGGRTTIVLR